MQDTGCFPEIPTKYILTYFLSKMGHIILTHTVQTSYSPRIVYFRFRTTLSDPEHKKASQGFYINTEKLFV